MATEMMSTRRLARTWHGLVAGETLPSGSSGRSVVLAEVQNGSPAEASGFRPGDQVTRIGEMAINTPLDIERALLDVPPGHPMRVLVRRDGKEQPIDLEVRALGAQPARPAVAAVAVSPADAADQVYRLLGVKTQPVSPEYVTAASAKLRGGLYVQSVAPNSLAARALIQKGDILVGMNVGLRHWETIRPDNVLFILRQPEVASAQALQFYIVRRNGIHQGTMSLAELPGSGVGVMTR